LPGDLPRLPAFLRKPFKLFEVVDVVKRLVGDGDGVA